MLTSAVAFSAAEPGPASRDRSAPQRRHHYSTDPAARGGPLNTFLPYPDFEESARALDDKRLGKQRVEVLQILNVLTIPERKGWRNHPCTLMWKGHETALCDYGIAICQEWRRRGYRDTVLEKISAIRIRLSDGPLPAWLGDAAFHAAHRSNLLRKDETYYRRHGWTEPADLEYVWPAQL